MRNDTRRVSRIQIVEGLVLWEFKLHPGNGKLLKGFKQRTDSDKFVILKDFSLKIPLLRKVLQSWKAEKPVKILLT